MFPAGDYSLFHMQEMKSNQNQQKWCMQLVKCSDSLLFRFFCSPSQFNFHCFNWIQCPSHTIYDLYFDLNSDKRFIIGGFTWRWTW